MVMIVLALLVLACSPERADSEESTRRQAGQPPDSLQTAVRLAAIRAAALRGDQDGIQKHAAAMQEDLRLAMRLPDPMRRIEQEPARAAVMRVEGVRSAGWVDRDHLLVRVDGYELRTQAMIDRVCGALEPLGDTLGVVVNLQSAVARSADEMQTLTRNCQLPPGERALAQRPRQMDVIPADIRQQHREAQTTMRPWNEEDARRRAERREAARRILEASTPEM
ncbi:hypothetical protein WCE55_12480 [Luteimonas sp. MJ293]|uniref:hypothetical protein n=1 Tax=Luteimonas sp. MJ146 TaxID=3129240 RepID=UPI0031BBABCE